ncbi:MAG: hypothetical protein J5659_03455 [Clostridia bacterium]|nr:hypothetical protein [Clostridia bacterium]
MKTINKIGIAVIAGLVLLCARKAKGAASVGKVERIKRRIYKEVSLAQSSGVDFSKKYDQLTPDEKQALERIGHEFGWKQSKRAIETGKTYTESYYSSLRRAWNAVSGIEGVGRAYNVKDAKGNVCLTWIEDAAAHYDAEQRTLEAEQRAMEARKRLQSMRRKVSGISGYRHNYFGGNSGYSGYSMSKRAIEAREDGRYPKTDFLKVYHITENSLFALVELGYINNSEWHHTSSWGNRTTFYGWDEPEFAQLYADNKKQIDTWARNGELNEIDLMFDEFRDRVYEDRQAKWDEEQIQITIRKEKAKRFYEELVDYLGGNVWYCNRGYVPFDERVYDYTPIMMTAYDNDGKQLSSYNNKALRDEIKSRFYEWLKDYKNNKMI